MGLIASSNAASYYQGNNHGDYQFTSLEDIVRAFMVTYVGDNKIIPKIRTNEVAFHAKRALQELSFDTFKSFKAFEIIVPATLQMILPEDYVNYTKLSLVDSSGIKHPLYPTKHTSNPFSVAQDSDGNYSFPSGDPNLGVNMDFEGPLVSPWNLQTPHTYAWGSNQNGWNYYSDDIYLDSGALNFKQTPQKGWDHNKSRIYAVWQVLDVSSYDTIELSATGTTGGVASNTIGGTLRIGISTSPPDPSTNISYPGSASYSSNHDINYVQTLEGDDAVLEWTPGLTSTIKTFNDSNAVNVSNINTVYVIVTSFADFTTTPQNSSLFANGTYSTLFSYNSIDDILINSLQSSAPLTHANAQGNSTAWNNYKSITPSENNNDDYEDDTYWPIDGERYGLEPSHAQVNGSFFIDQRLGKIHFSSNVSGKTIILDYISDSLGTNAEMQVHKFAEDAMYKWMIHSIMLGSSYGQALIPRLAKEKFAAIRKAKLRLSNIKLEELTQILRGKSKWIKH